MTWDSDTSQTRDDDVALGDGFNEVIGQLVALKRQDPLAFVGSGFYQRTFERDNITPGDQIGFSVGAVLAASPETSLRVFLNQAFIDDQKIGNRVVNGSDQVDSNLTFGASSVLGRGVLLDVAAGVGLTLQLHL